MSNLSNRKLSAEPSMKQHLFYGRDQFILNWWGPLQDALAADQISKQQWAWKLGVQEGIIKITPPDQLDTWRNTDPLCSEWSWQYCIVSFAELRVQILGLDKTIREPRQKVCLLCRREYSEDSLPVPCIRRLGIERLDFCADCLFQTVYPGTGDLYTSREEILRYLQKLSNLLGAIPRQDFGAGMTDLHALDDKERVELLQLLKTKPNVQRVQNVFGSWLNALIEAGIVENGARPTSRGTQCIAKDGHMCLSLGEKTIDDFLHNHGIQHDKEPHYPEGNFRADFKVGMLLIEYFGLAGNPEYDAKIAEKNRICKKHGITLVAIYPQDLAGKGLEKKLSSVMP
jgi:hypothetical protein